MTQAPALPTPCGSAVQSDSPHGPQADSSPPQPCALPGFTPPGATPGAARALLYLNPKETSVNAPPASAALPPAARSLISPDSVAPAHPPLYYLPGTPLPPPAPDGSPPDLTPDQVFRHSGWEDVRSRIRRAMFRTGQSVQRLEAFDKCGSECHVMENMDEPGQLRLSSNYCHDRFCTPCALARARQIQQALQAAIGNSTTSFLTLTLQHRKQSLNKTIDDLYRHFRALRAHPEWKSHVQGGAAFLEVKWSDQSRSWHPHIHVIMHARYWDQGAISTIWQTITHDSYIVDIRRVSDLPTISGYIVKYATKPLNNSFLRDENLLDQAIMAMRGRRLCLTFGSWYGTPLSQEIDHAEGDDIMSVGKWQSIGTLSQLHARACAGDSRARAALESLPAYRAFLTRPADPPD